MRPGQSLDEASRPDLSLWRQRTADSLVVGSVTRLADGRYDVRFRLWDVVRGQDLGGQSYTVPQADLRLASHRIADYVYEKLTGEKGIFSTRICYVTKGGSRYSLWVADADGENAQAALASPEPIISPVWSSNGGADRVCVVRVAQAGGVRAQRVQRPAPAGRQFSRFQQRARWAPDGKTLAVTLSRDGGSQPLHHLVVRRRAATGSRKATASIPSPSIRLTEAPSTS